MIRRIRNYFFAGLLVVVPFGITIWIIWGLFNFFDSWFRQLMRYYGMQSALQEYYSWFPEYGIGFLLTILIICLIGFFAQLYVGKKLIELFEFFLLKIPGINSIYNGLKQVSQSLMGRQKKLFEAVAMIEYPRRDIYSLCFIISEDDGLMKPILKRDLIYIFLPTTPNPTSGFYLIIPKEDLIPLDISVEDGMKMIISSGMVVPNKIREVNIPLEEHLKKQQEKNEKEATLDPKDILE